jgi:hypothetical protein
MDKDLEKLIKETVEKFFESAPAKMIKKGERKEYYDVCPHCNEEIYEKHEFTEDGGLTWRHSDCKGLIERPETPMEDIVPWLRPYVDVVRKEKQQSKGKLKTEVLPPCGDLPIGGEEKYYQQKPGGEMMAVNVVGPGPAENKK